MPKLIFQSGKQRRFGVREGMKEGDGTRSIEEGALNAYKIHFLGDGTLVSGVVEARILYES